MLRRGPLFALLLTLAMPSMAVAAEVDAQAVRETADEVLAELVLTVGLQHDRMASAEAAGTKAIGGSGTARDDLIQALERDGDAIWVDLDRLRSGEPAEDPEALLAALEAEEPPVPRRKTVTWGRTGRSGWTGNDTKLRYAAPDMGGTVGDLRVKPLDLRFKTQDASLTLREALSEHRANIPGLVDVPEDPVEELDELFAGHDTIHCLFGLGTTTAEEVRVDAYSVVASTLSFPRYLTYVSHPVVAKVIWETTTLATLPHILISVLRIPLIWWRTRSMKQWDFDGWRDHLDRPLAEIRAEYRIRVDGA